MRGSRNIFRGGGFRPDGQKTVWMFLVLQLILQFTEGVQWFYYRDDYFSKDPEGVQHFPVGGGPPPPSGSAHENLHDVLIADLHCRASRP